MVGRLKLVLQNQRLQLLLKSFIFAGLLAWVKAGDFGFLPILFFLFFSLYMFRGHPYSLMSQNFYSFLALIVVSLGVTNILNRQAFVFLAILFFSVLFYLILGIKELIFVHRQQWYAVKNILLFYSLFLFFFLWDKSSYFFIKYLSFFVLTFFLLREWLFWSEQNFPKRQLLASFVLAFVVVEILWSTAILPIGFISSANIMILITYLLVDSNLRHFQGTLNKKVILRNLGIFALAIIFVLITSKWNSY